MSPIIIGVIIAIIDSGNISENLKSLHGWLMAKENIFDKKFDFKSRFFGLPFLKFINFALNKINMIENRGIRSGLIISLLIYIPVLLIYLTIVAIFLSVYVFLSLILLSLSAYFLGTRVLLKKQIELTRAGNKDEKPEIVELNAELIEDELKRNPKLDVEDFDEFGLPKRKTK